MSARWVAVLALALAVGAVPADAREAASPGSGQRRGTAGIGDPYFPLDGNGGIDVVHYDVRDAYDLRARVLSGRTRLRIEALEDLSRFDLDFLLPVEDVRVAGRRADFEQRAGHELLITPRRPVEAGDTFSVTVTYAGAPGARSYLGERNWLADRREVVAVNEPHMAPWWFPANDHPRDKATMDVRITVPRRLRVVSNGLPVGRRVRGALATTHWSSAEPMATYAAFFAAGPFDVRRGELDGRPWVVAVSTRLDRDQQQASMASMLTSPSLTAWLESQLGDYPFASTGGVVTSLNPGFALETQSRPTYAATGPRSTTLLVHELAHQWFGDSVSVRSWRDIVLNEGFASFMERRYAETHGGESAGQWLDRVYDSLDGQTGFWSLRVDDPGPVRMFDQPVYLRGAMSVQALRNRVGEDDFWQILRTWLSSRAGSNGATGDFIALAEQVSGEDLGPFFDAWWHATSQPARTEANGLAPG